MAIEVGHNVVIPLDVSPSSVKATGSTTARSLQNRFGEVFNAKDYGAKCDGTTDDAASCQAALDAVPAVGGHVVVPDGNVKLGSTLTISKAGTLLSLGTGTYTSTANPAISVTAGNVTIRGAGYFATQLYVNSATNDGISVDGGVPGISGVAIEDMAIPCHSGANTRTAGYAVHLVKVGNWCLRGLYIRDPWIGIAIDNSNTGFASDITIDTTLAAQSLYDGVQVVNTSVSNHFARVLVTSSATAVNSGFYVGLETDTASFVDCSVQASGAAGASYGWIFALDGGSYAPRWIKIIGPYVEVAKTTGIGFQLDHVTDCEIVAPYSVWGLYNYHLTANAKAVKIRGGTGQLAYQYGVLIDGGTDVLIDGLTVSDASQQTNITYDGIALAGGDGVRIVNVRSGNHIWAGASPASATNFQRYGILTTGAVDNYTIVGCDTRNALGTGGISDTATGTNKQVFGNKTNAGVGTAVGGAFSPPTDGGALQGGRVYMGSGVPNNANGQDGDVYIRTDTPATANQRVYNRQAGAWVGLL